MKIITVDDVEKAVLYKKSIPVLFPMSQEVVNEISSMCAFYKTIKNKAGFAAPQVGISRRILLIEQSLVDGGGSDEPVVLINPQWKPLSDEMGIDYEGCLSVPKKVGFVERYRHVLLNAWQYNPIDASIIEITREYRNEFSSVVWQHEIDHLDGIVYVDKAKYVMEEDAFHRTLYQLYNDDRLNDHVSFFDAGQLAYALVQEQQTL